MPLVVDCFWSFRSPYSYLATPRMVRLAAEYDLEMRVRPVLPLAVRKPDFFEQVNPLWLPYLARDVMRLAQWLDVPFGMPRPDPIVQDFATRKISPDQPYIYRLTRLGAAAAERGRALSFIDEVSRLIWGGEVIGWHEGTHLADAAARAGLDLAEMDAAVATDPARFDAMIAENQAGLDAVGHWGVPTFGFDGEPFFGQDRLDLLVWRLEQHGLRKR